MVLYPWSRTVLLTWCPWSGMGVVTKIGAVVHRRRFVALAKYTHATGRRGKSPPFPGRSVVHRTWRCGNICGILCVGIPTIGLPNSLWLLSLTLLAGASRCQRCIFPVGLRRPVSRLLLPFGFVATKKPSATYCGVQKIVACRVAGEETWRAYRRPSAWHQRQSATPVSVEYFWVCAEAFCSSWTFAGSPGPRSNRHHSLVGELSIRKLRN